jgi:hypothetical protein
MIDKVDIRIPARLPFEDEFSWIGEQLRRNGRVDRCSPSLHYRAVVDLRTEGLSALLHAGLKHGPEGNHKVEIIDAGELSYADMLRTVEAIFPIDVRPLKIIRIDLCADVRGIPVNWFVSSVRVRFKRFGANLGKLDFQTMGRGGVETAYFGKRPNCFRIYDKLAERRATYGRLFRRCFRLRKLPQDAPDVSTETLLGVQEKQPPAFEEWSGLDESRIYTRIERQIGGCRVPCVLDTVGKLTKLEEFNPFSPLLIDPGQIEMPKRGDYPLDVWMAGHHYVRMIQEDGLDAANRWVRKQAGPHAARALETYRPFIPRIGAGITSDQLYENFRKSVHRQLSSPQTYLLSDGKFSSAPAGFGGKIQNKKDCEISQ